MAVQLIDNIKASSGRFGSVSVQVCNKHGIVTQSWTQPMDSLVENWWRWWRAQMMVANDDNGKRISDGANQTLGATADYRFSGDAGLDYLGVLVGSGNTPVSIADWGLAERITHGNGPGQLSFASVQRPSSPNTINADRETVQIHRVITNNSGASVTVREVGVSMSPSSSESADLTFLAARDVLAQEAVVPDQGAITVAYRFRYQDGIQASLHPIFTCACSGAIVVKDTSGNNSTFSNLNGGSEGRDGWNHNNGLNSGWGIRVGSGNITPEAWDNFTWDALIDYGSVDGQLTAESNSFSDWSVDAAADEMEMTIERLLTNQGSTTITIREIMIRGSWRWSSLNNIDLLSYRRVPAQDVVFPAGRSDFIRFTIRYSL